MGRSGLLLALGLAAPACTEPPRGREARVVQILAEDNYLWARREPALVAGKLAKMQRGPYEWLRGTAALFWADLSEPGGHRAATQFGDEASSRVLLVGDPHPENAGTFRASDGTLLVDWNDFDASGYGPFTGDLRRLGAGLAIVARLGAPGDEAYAESVVRAATSAYATAIGELAGGGAIAEVGMGVDPLLDKELRKAGTRGDAHVAVDELAPRQGGVRVLAEGDLEPVAADGVIEDRVVAVDAETAARLDAAIAGWDARARVVLRARRIGSGVSSYAARRYNVVLDDDRILELKEERDGVIVPGLPVREAGPWDAPEARAVATQRVLQARPDEDPLLGGALGFKIRDREAYQRGVNATDLEALAAGDSGDRAHLVALAAIYGRLLARAHGNAPTLEGARGASVIAPLLAGREPAFIDELTASALADADQITADFTASRDIDLAALVVP